MENCDPEMLDALYRAAKSSHKKLVSNCPLGIATLVREAERGSLCYEERDEGLLVYLDRVDHLELKYFLDSASSFPQIHRTELPVLLEELDANGKREVYIHSLFSQLEQQGWLHWGENLQVVTELSNDLVEQRRSSARLAQNGGYRIARTLSDDQAEQVCRLWRMFLRTTDVPHEHFDFAHDPSQHIVCALDTQGEVCAANWWQKNKSACEIRHTVTAAEHRRRGLGQIVVLASLADATEAGCVRAFTYIDSSKDTLIKSP